jgi:phenylpropionate dioxygenase-like ring-hydroxylating dioxygenase large terminal subunit
MTYIRNAWYVAAWADELALERPVGVCILNEPIVIWRNARGDLTAFEDRCVHRSAPLSLGRCEGERLRCLYHGLVYERTGHVSEIPGENGRLPRSLRVRAYPVAERHGWIWVWLGNRADADEGLIPPVLGVGRPGFAFGRSQLDYAAEARLVNENLLDLSHASFLHIDSFHVSETWARARPKVTGQQRSVCVEWWIKDEPPLGSLISGQPPVDTYLRYEFFVPGVLLMATRTYPTGTADALNGRDPDLSQPELSITSQAITPTSWKTTRYFYSMGQRGETVDMAVTEKAFGEDKRMIEAQQRSIDAAPDRHFMPTAVDKAIITYNRLVEGLGREESERAVSDKRSDSAERPGARN